MLSLSERILVRDILFDKLEKIHVIMKYVLKEGTYKLYRRQSLTDAISNDYNLRILYNLYISEFDSEDEAIWCLIRKDDYTNHMCPICGKKARFYNIKRGYRATCVTGTCFGNYLKSDTVQEKYKNTCRLKFGYDHPSKVPGFYEKFKARCLELYGYDNPMKVPMFRDKFIQTMLNKYNVCYPLQHPEFLKKSEDSCERNNGVRHPTQSLEIQERIKAENREKYGSDWFMGTEEFKRKTEETNMRKRNVKNVMQDPEVVEIWRKSFFENNSIVNPILLQEIQPFLDQIKEGLTLAEAYSNHEYFEKLIHLLYNYKQRSLYFSELMKIFDKANYAISHRIHNLELEEYFDIQESQLELQVKDFLISNGYKEKEDFTRYNHILLTENNTYQEIDFLVNNNIGFEIDDLGGHNINEKDSNYHINKTLMARDQHNIRLIHLWEWELNETNWPKTSQWILHILNQNKIQLDIKDCIIKEVTKEEQLIFLDQYNLNGYLDSDICLGLYYNNELIQIMSFINISQNNDWQLICMCTKFNYNVDKGYKNILIYFIKKYNSSIIYTHVDLSKEGTEDYEDIGFQSYNQIEPIIISGISNENSTYKQVYNCGFDIMYFIN